MENVPHKAPHFSYMISPRDASVGGGWRLQLFEQGLEVAGGAFTAAEGEDEAQVYLDAMDEGDAWLLSKAKALESGTTSGQSPRAAQWTFVDAIEAVKRAQAFPGWDRLPQPMRSEIDTAAYLLTRIPCTAATVAGGIAAGHFHRDTAGAWREVPRSMAGTTGVVVLYHGPGWPATERKGGS